MSITPSPADSVLVLIDVQERLAPAMFDFAATAGRISLLLRGAAELGIRVIACEQYPKGLGHTLPEIAELLPPATPVIEKSGFSAFVAADFTEALEKTGAGNLIFCGIEAHVCVLQSVCHALERGFNVMLAADATTSRKPADRELAHAHARSAGATVLSAEALLFALLGDAAHPAFKAISRLVR